MGAVSSAPSDLSDYDEDPTEATLIYETVNLNDVKNDSSRPGSGKQDNSSQQEDKYKKVLSEELHFSYSVFSKRAFAGIQSMLNTFKIICSSLIWDQNVDI